MERLDVALRAARQLEAVAARSLELVEAYVFFAKDDPPTVLRMSRRELGLAELRRGLREATQTLSELENTGEGNQL